MRDIAIDDLYKAYGDEVYSYLLQRLRCAETASDLKQETFIKIMHPLSEGSIENPRAYLYRIAANLVADHFKRAWTRVPKESEAVLEAVPDNAPDPERTTAAVKDLDRLQDAINQLPARQREIVRLQRIEGLSAQEVADKLGISRNTVRALSVRALSKLRTLYLGDKNDQNA